MAASYDKLADAPVEVGKFSGVWLRPKSGAHFRVVVDGNEWHREKLESILQDITKYEIHLMGGAPFSEYTFFYHFGPYPEVGGGGWSTPIAPRSLLLQATRPPPSQRMNFFTPGT